MTTSQPPFLPRTATTARPVTRQFALLVLGIAAAGVVPGSPRYGSWDGTDPVLTACSAPEQLRPPDRFPGLLGEGAVVTLRYSYGCRTAWTELTGAEPDAEAWVERSSDGRREACTAGSDGRCATAQLDDADTYACAGAHDSTTTVQTACY